jgi:hypothetical protein
MRPDIYTKALLTVIAVMLAAMLSKPYIDKPEPVAKPEPARFAAVQFVYLGGAPYFFDTRTGEVWGYNTTQGYGIPDGSLTAKYRLVKLGQPLVKEYDWLHKK